MLYEVITLLRMHRIDKVDMGGRQARRVRADKTMHFNTWYQEVIKIGTWPDTEVNMNCR